MIILTMQLQRIVAERLGNLNRINLLLSRVYGKKNFVMTTVIAMLKYASRIVRDHMTANYQRIPSKFSRTAKVVIDRAFISSSWKHILQCRSELGKFLPEGFSL